MTRSRSTPARSRAATRSKPQTRPRSSSALPIIVAVGASAGGLEAFSALLPAFPPDTVTLNMALVFLQHLQPSHPSILAELLQKTTSLPVNDATDGVLPQAGHVYVLPAGQEMVLKAGKLRLNPRPAHEISQPIDLFMRSLAAERKSAAIGVVLAGTASDGTLGLEAIKAQGGICFAQSEDTTQFSGMIRSALSSGCVDYVLPPADIARELSRVVRHLHLPSAADAKKDASVDPSAIAQRTYAGILDLIRRDANIDFSEYRSSTIGRRIARRMALHTLERPEDYLRYLRAHPPEVAQLSADILIPATRFFRDAEVFALLKSKVLGPLVRQHQSAGAPIRLWSVGGSTGEEAYSLAMIALECLGGQGGGGATVQVFGTDLNESVVRRARAGHYGAEIAADVSPERLSRFFSKTEGGYQVARALRETCIFARHNVMREAPFSRLDLICCRNVMIYMEPTLQARLLPILHYALNPGGTLVLGSAESVGSAPRLFKSFARTNRRLKIYTKLGASAPVHFPVHEQPVALQARPAPARLRADGPEDAHQHANRILLDQFAPPGVIVDNNLDVIEFRGRTAEFLEPAPGAASLNLFKMARGNLGAYVRSAVLQARKQQAPIRVEGIKSDHGLGEIALQVVPLASPGHDQPQFLVLFLAGAANPSPNAASTSPGKSRPAPSGRRSNPELDRLRRSLASSQQLITTLSDEFQAAKQEYQAANEEIASANEELQSTNE
ncbi:MAG: CheR family methyltransferase, partial [Terriglobales bacterium]